MRESREIVLPLVYGGIALVMVAALIPTALRPPQQAPPGSAELSPDAPPDEQNEILLGELSRARSATAGAGIEAAPELAVQPTPEPVTQLRPPRGQCFGNPPRQTESAYAPPCRPAFVGDNGGATYKNVTGDEVRMGFWHILGMPRERGPVGDEPPPSESAEHRTARVLQRYFNERYELYGRALRLVAIENDSDQEPELRASALHGDVQERLFAAVHLFWPFCDEFSRRGLICFSGNPFPAERFTRRAPLMWAYQMDTDKVDRIAGEYVCKKLVGRDADFAGGVDRGRPRRIGVIVESVPVTAFRSSEGIVRELREQCGYEAVANVDVGDGGETGALATAIARMRAAEVTTIVLQAALGPAVGLMSQADGSAYFPEWVMFNSYGLDFNGSARLLSPTQMRQTFGMGGWELPRPAQHRDCYRAYKSVDPDGTPNANFCNLLWISLEHIVNGIQEAGPELDPETFRDGLFRMPLSPPRAEWAIGGGYGPGDHTFVNTFTEIWWDPNGIDPDGGQRGAWRHTAGGRRWGPGELTGELLVFRDGVTGYEEP